MNLSAITHFYYLLSCYYAYLQRCTGAPYIVTVSPEGNRLLPSVTNSFQEDKSGHMYQKEADDANATEDVCPDNCAPGESCSLTRGHNCKPCVRGYYSVDGSSCIPCSCALGSTSKSVCDPVTGKCICDNTLNLCESIVIFGSTSTLVWFLLIVLAATFTCLVQYSILHRNLASERESNAAYQTVAMLKLQNALVGLHLAEQSSDSASLKGGANSSKSNQDEQQRVRSIEKPGSGSKSSSRSQKLPAAFIKAGEFSSKRGSHGTGSIRSKMNGLTKAILNTNKEKTHHAKHQQKKKSEKPKRLSGKFDVEGEFYIDRVTGKKVKDISWSAEDEGEVLSITFPTCDIQDSEITGALRGERFTDDDITSQHFGLISIDGSVVHHEDEQMKTSKKKRSRKRKNSTQ